MRDTAIKVSEVKTTSARAGNSILNLVVLSMPFFLVLLDTSTSLLNPATLSRVPIEGMMTVPTDPYHPILMRAVYLLAAIVVMMRLDLVFKIIQGHWAYFLFLIYAALSFSWASNPMESLKTAAFFVIALAACLSAAVAYDRNSKAFFAMLVIYSFVSLSASLIAVYFFPGRGIDEYGRWMGVTTHPNQLGIIALLAVWANIIYMYYTKNLVMKVFNAGVILLALWCLRGSNSMTSTILMLLIILSVPTVMSFDGKTPLNNLVKLTLVFFAGMFVIFMAYLIEPELFATKHFFGAIGRTSSFTGRVGIWETGWDAFMERPLTGWGFNDLTWKGADMHHLHNGYLDMLTRGGIIGLIFIIYFVIKMWFYLLRIAKVDFRVFTAFSIFLLVILLHNVTEGSFGRGLTTLWLIFSFMYLFLNRNNASLVGNPRP
jgi:exopolysaccharide production protein ExoQ